MSLKVSEIFDSLQGEGLYIGRLATFIRLQGCNLRCEWCDTPLSRDPDRAGSAMLMDENEIVSAVLHPLVIVTGGEPLLQDIRALVDKLKRTHHEVHIETNGTIRPGADLIRTVDFWSVSPKRGHTEDAFRTITALKQAGVKAQVKFVIRGADQMENYNDLKWAKSFADLALYPSSGIPVILQPMWQHPVIKGDLGERYRERMKQMAYTIKQRWPTWDVRLIPQMHKLFSLDRKCHDAINRKKKGKDADEQGEGGRSR